MNKPSSTPKAVWRGAGAFLGRPPDKDGSGPFGRVLQTCGGSFFIALAISGVVISLMVLAPRSPQNAVEADPPDAIEGLAVVRSEVVHIFMPETLTDLAIAPSGAHGFQTHDELRRFLEIHNLKDVWYALNISVQHVNGEFSDVTVVRRAYSNPFYFQEFLDILSTAAGKPPRYPTSDFTRARIVTVPRELLNVEPAGVISKLRDQGSIRPR